jgi:hypothetical protein
LAILIYIWSLLPGYALSKEGCCYVTLRHARATPLH